MAMESTETPQAYEALIGSGQLATQKGIEVDDDARYFLVYAQYQP